MPKAIVLREHGGPENLRLEDVSLPALDPQSLRIRQTAIGVNFHDIYVRTGLYRTLALPGIAGIEGVGVVEEIGRDVKEFKVGDRVGYVTMEYGAYAAERILPSRLAVKLPGSVSDELAASILLKGLTVQMLVKQSHKIQPGETILVHAAAGAVGQILVRWASYLGANVIGTVGSIEKEKTARESGCQHVIFYRQDNFVERVAEITASRGVDVVYDSVGKDTFSGSLACLSTGGHVIAFGQSSGNVAPFTLTDLAKNSLGVSRPIVFHYTADRGRYLKMAADLFDAIERGVARTNISLTLPLAEIAEAHRRMEARSTTGATLLLP